MESQRNGTEGSWQSSSVKAEKMPHKGTALDDAMNVDAFRDGIYCDSPAWHGMWLPWISCSPVCPLADQLHPFKVVQSHILHAGLS